MESFAEFVRTVRLNVSLSTLAHCGAAPYSTDANVGADADNSAANTADFRQAGLPVGGRGDREAKDTGSAQA
jgi:hypothetical protein